MYKPNLSYDIHPGEYLTTRFFRSLGPPLFWNSIFITTLCTFFYHSKAARVVLFDFQKSVA